MSTTYASNPLSPWWIVGSAGLITVGAAITWVVVDRRHQVSELLGEPVADGGVFGPDGGVFDPSGPVRVGPPHPDVYTTRPSGGTSTAQPPAVPASDLPQPSAPQRVPYEPSTPGEVGPGSTEPPIESEPSEPASSKPIPSTSTPSGSGFKPILPKPQTWGGWWLDEKVTQYGVTYGIYLERGIKGVRWHVLGIGPVIGPASGSTAKYWTSRSTAMRRAKQAINAKSWS